ncbi:MAG: anthranilate synthase component I [Pseudohongiellaceae bacterium]
MSIQQTRYPTAGGVTVQRHERNIPYENATSALVERLDAQRGLLLSSSFEYPGRYTRWDIGFVNPPVVITARGRELRIEALNRRGEILLPELHRALLSCDAVEFLEPAAGFLTMRVRESDGPFAEEKRSRQPSVFSVLRAVSAHFHSKRDNHLGLYGAFGYDLAFQFEPVVSRQTRDPGDRDLVLYLPDELIVVDHHGRRATNVRYEFVCRDDPRAGDVHHAAHTTTGGLQRHGRTEPYYSDHRARPGCDHRAGEYADTVRQAQKHFADGRLFEVVPGQVFHEPCPDAPSQVFRRLKEANPAPYGALINLGEQEYLVAASPEMYVRVNGNEVETCPISGTIARGGDALGDARQIRSLLNSAKDEAELSMCTDVDRNDKSRVCVPGSVTVSGRRQIEMYSRLIHTVDHVKGQLAPEYDAFDAFLTHTWAVTVTGAPKASAMQFIEEHERSPRHWYGGAMGQIGFDGNMNTGLTLRTIRIRDGVAQIRAGATLLVDSEPEAEEAETRLKASALLSAIRGGTGCRPDGDQPRSSREVLPGAEQLRVLMVDHRDSFVHNLGSYFREYGVQMVTLRPGMAREALRGEETDFDLVVLSPGPGRPEDFDLSSTLALCVERRLPVFGVCLGLQGIVEHFGGELGLLDRPVHGRSARLRHDGQGVFLGLPADMEVGRYHSLCATALPDCLEATAHTESDAVVMGVRHRSMPVTAVQFHPESIMTLEGYSGHGLIRNVLANVLHRREDTASGVQREAESGVQYATRKTA